MGSWGSTWGLSCKISSKIFKPEHPSSSCRIFSGFTSNQECSSTWLTLQPWHTSRYFPSRKLYPKGRFSWILLSILATKPLRGHFSTFSHFLRFCGCTVPFSTWNWKWISPSIGCLSTSWISSKSCSSGIASITQNRNLSCLWFWAQLREISNRQQNGLLQVFSSNDTFWFYQAHYPCLSWNFCDCRFRGWFVRFLRTFGVQ